MALPYLFADSPTPGTAWSVGTLAAPVASTDTALSMSAAAPASLQASPGQFDMVIDSEYFTIDASTTSGTTWSILARGGSIGPNPATTHTFGTPAYYVATAETFGGQTDPVAGKPGLRSLGTGSQQAANGSWLSGAQGLVPTAAGAGVAPALQFPPIAGLRAGLIAAPTWGAMPTTTGPFVNSGTGNLTGSASGYYMIAGAAGTGALMTLPLPGAFNLAISPPASGKYCCYGIELTPSGTWNLTRGTDQASSALAQANAPAVTSGNYLMWQATVLNTAGVFTSAGAVVKYGYATGQFEPTVVNASATITSPAGANYAIIQVIAGGGGPGGGGDCQVSGIDGSTGGQGGGGGGGGQVTWTAVAVVSTGSTYGVVVGAAGTSGVNASGPGLDPSGGGTGGDTTINAGTQQEIRAKGGQGGQGGDSGNNSLGVKGLGGAPGGGGLLYALALANGLVGPGNVTMPGQGGNGVTVTYAQADQGGTGSSDSSGGGGGGGAGGFNGPSSEWLSGGNGLPGLLTVGGTGGTSHSGTITNRTAGSGSGGGGGGGADTTDGTTTGAVPKAAGKGQVVFYWFSY